MENISVEKIKEMLRAAKDEGYEAELTLNFCDKSSFGNSMKINNLS